MADTTTPNAAEPTSAQAPADAQEAPASNAAPRAPRTVTLPVLPLAIVGAIIVALIFFGGGIAVGFAIGDHPARVGIIQPFNQGRNGGQNGFGQNNGTRPNNAPTTAPKNG
jgi:hypothetical protein